ncbi:MAG TPA: lysophospholipid acyltransferase family protein [Treponema sp.]|nr:lysophospholipid acyltransferase family protein [Treponema sp.]HRS04634.1 lysophospholipid acyltransferase family protein [Treponema sp.]
MQKAKQRRHITNLQWFNRILKWSYGRWLRKVYQIEARGLETIQTLRPPYVIVANHVSTRDPFWISSLLPQPVYWVGSDSNMRSSIMRWLLKLVGTIPKAKVIPDIETVNDIVHVIRKQQGIVGLFPEGAQSWNGETLPLVPSTAKLLKLLKVPVLRVIIRGGYFALPRWTWKRRKGPVVLDFSLLFSPEELNKLPVDEIERALIAGLSHNDFTDPVVKDRAYRSSRLAEHLELSLYLCPNCETFGSLRSLKNQLFCNTCGALWRVDPFYRLHTISAPYRSFASIGQWDAWQYGTVVTTAERVLRESPNHPVISDAGVLLLQGHKANPLRRIRTGTLVLFPDRLELATLSGERLAFPLKSLEGITVLKRHLLEFYQGRNLYQVRFPFRYMSARKWTDMMLALQDTILRATGPQG